jgi:hypothetical protein
MITAPTSPSRSPYSRAAAAPFTIATFAISAAFASRSHVPAAPSAWTSRCDPS